MTGLPMSDIYSVNSPNNTISFDCIYALPYTSLKPGYQMVIEVNVETVLTVTKVRNLKWIKLKSLYQTINYHSDVRKSPNLYTRMLELSNSEWKDGCFRCVQNYQRRATENKTISTVDPRLSLTDEKKIKDHDIRQSNQYQRKNCLPVPKTEQCDCSLLILLTDRQTDRQTKETW